MLEHSRQLDIVHFQSSSRLGVLFLGTRLIDSRVLELLICDLTPDFDALPVRRTHHHNLEIRRS